MTLQTYYCPIELTGSRARGVPPERRFFFIVIEALTPYDACIMFRIEAIKLMGGTDGYSRWWPTRDKCPTIGEMMKLRYAYDRSRGRAVRAPELTPIEVAA